MTLPYISSKEFQADSTRIGKDNYKTLVTQNMYICYDGFVTQYGYTCGYQDSFIHNGFFLTLGLECEGNYHIRIRHETLPRTLWNVYEDYKEAKKAFKSFRKQILNNATVDFIKSQEQ